MDTYLENTDPSHNCICGRSFSQPGALKYHRRSCKKTKTCLEGALSKAKGAWITRKKRRIEGPEERPNDVLDSGGSENFTQAAQIVNIDVCL